MAEGESKIPGPHADALELRILLGEIVNRANVGHTAGMLERLASALILARRERGIEDPPPGEGRRVPSILGGLEVWVVHRDGSGRAKGRARCPIPTGWPPEG